MLSSVQPSAMCTERIGRLWLKSMISFMRTPKICPETLLAASLRRKTAIGAILSGVIFFARSSRACCSGVSAGIVPIMRVQAKGEMQFERTSNAFMSSAIDFERPTMPIFAAA
jgi:hypothetical protein